MVNLEERGGQRALVKGGLGGNCEVQRLAKITWEMDEAGQAKAREGRSHVRVANAGRARLDRRV